MLGLLGRAMSCFEKYHFHCRDKSLACRIVFVRTFWLASGMKARFGENDTSSKQDGKEGS